MSTGTEKEFRFRFSLRGLLIALFVLGAGFGVLGRLFRQNPQIFAVVVGVLSSIVPYLFAVGTIIWIGARRRQLGLCLWGLLLIVIPFVGTGVIWVTQRYAAPSPGNLGMLDTKQLIEQELPKQVDAPWVWNELDARLKSGKLSPAEADAAVGQLIAHMKSTKPEGWDQPLSWQGEFLVGCDRGGLLADAVKFDLCDAFYGPNPVIQPLPRLREGSQGFDIQVEYGSAWGDHFGIAWAHLWHIDRILLDGTPIKVEQHFKHGERWSGFCNETVAVGDHELTFEVTCAYVDRTKLIGLDAQSLPPARWPAGGKRWTGNVSTPLKVFTPDEPLVKLTTDANLDPRSGIQVKRCVIQADEAGKKKVIVEMEIGGTISMSCDVSITLAGQTVPLGSQWIARHENGSTRGGSNLSAIIDSLDPVIEYAEIPLTPNPKHIEHRPEVTEIWGRLITLSGVPVERLDLELHQ